MKINKYEDISQIDREAKKDYIDRHSAFVYFHDFTPFFVYCLIIKIMYANYNIFGFLQKYITSFYIIRKDIKNPIIFLFYQQGISTFLRKIVLRLLENC